MRAVEQKRSDVREARKWWILGRQPLMRRFLHRLGFIDETSLKTNMCKTTGWAPRGERPIDHAPFGHWNTQTFIAALRHDRVDAPWVLNGPMNRVRFESYVEPQIAPTLNWRDVIILDNLSSYHSPKAAEILRDIGAWFLFLPPYSPDLKRSASGARSRLQAAGPSSRSLQARPQPIEQAIFELRLPQKHPLSDP